MAQQVPVEVGQRVVPGANLARVAQPERLKAVVRIPETQARDVQIGQNGIPIPDKVQKFVGPQWGGVTPFAASSTFDLKSSVIVSG